MRRVTVSRGARGGECGAWGWDGWRWVGSKALSNSVALHLSPAPQYVRLGMGQVLDDGTETDSLR